MDKKYEAKIKAGFGLFEELTTLLPDCSIHFEVKRWTFTPVPSVDLNIHSAKSDDLVKLLKHYKSPITKNTLKTMQTAHLFVDRANEKFKITVFPEESTWRGCQLKVVGYRKELKEYPIYAVKCTQTIKNPSKRVDS